MLSLIFPSSSNPQNCNANCPLQHLFYLPKIKVACIISLVFPGGRPRKNKEPLNPPIKVEINEPLHNQHVISNASGLSIQQQLSQHMQQQQQQQLHQQQQQHHLLANQVKARFIPTK